jgi:hypothetical protein
VVEAVEVEEAVEASCFERNCGGNSSRYIRGRGKSAPVESQSLQEGHDLASPRQP